MISQYHQNYLDYLRYLGIYHHSNYFTYNSSMVMVYYTFKSIHRLSIHRPPLQSMAVVESRANGVSQKQGGQSLNQAVC